MPNKAALELFYDGLDTFCKKTVPDTLTTIRQLEHARLVYDAYRNDLDRMESKAANKAASSPSSTSQPAVGDETAAATTEGSTDTSSAPAPAPQQEANVQQLRQKFLKSKEDYLSLKADTDVKMKLLHENRVGWPLLKSVNESATKTTFPFYLIVWGGGREKRVKSSPF